MIRIAKEALNGIEDARATRRQHRWEQGFTLQAYMSPDSAETRQALGKSAPPPSEPATRTSRHGSSLHPAQQAFRAEVRDWLRQRPPRALGRSHDTREGFQSNDAMEASVSMLLAFRSSQN